MELRFLDGVHGYVIFDKNDPREGEWFQYDNGMWRAGQPIQIVTPPRYVDDPVNLLGSGEMVVSGATVRGKPRIWSGDFLSEQQLATRLRGGFGQTLLDHLLDGARRFEGRQGGSRATVRRGRTPPMFEAAVWVLQNYPPIVSATVFAILIEDGTRTTGQGWIRQRLEGEGLPALPMYAGPAGMLQLLQDAGEGVTAEQAVRQMIVHDKKEWYTGRPILEAQPAPNLVPWLARQVQSIVDDPSPASAAVPATDPRRTRVVKLTDELLGAPHRRRWGVFPILPGHDVRVLDVHDLSIHIRIGKIWDNLHKIIESAREDSGFLDAHDWERAAGVRK